MLTFKQFVQETNDNPDPEAIAKQIRNSLKAINKANATPEEKEFHTKKIKIMRDLTKKE